MALNSGCYYDKVYTPEPEGDISYSKDIQPFFDGSCVGCHSAGTGIPLNLETTVSYDNLINGGYISTGDPSSSVLYVKIAPGGSMETYATDNERALTLKWIEQGAKNN
jgi:hypothetical protein